MIICIKQWKTKIKPIIDWTEPQNENLNVLVFRKKVKRNILKRHLKRLKHFSDFLGEKKYLVGDQVRQLTEFLKMMMIDLDDDDDDDGDDERYRSWPTKRLLSTQLIVILRFVSHYYHHHYIVIIFVYYILFCFLYF